VPLVSSGGLWTMYSEKTQSKALTLNRRRQQELKRDEDEVGSRPKFNGAFIYSVEMGMFTTMPFLVLSSCLDCDFVTHHLCTAPGVLAWLISWRLRARMSLSTWMFAAGHACARLPV